MSSESSKNHPVPGAEHVLSLGNGSRVRTSATVMGSNLRMGKYPLNVSDSHQVSSANQQAQGHHLINITTIYGDLAPHSAGNAVHNNNANTSNVNHISPRASESVAQTFTAYSTQPRKISNHENKFKLVAVPSLHAANLQCSANSSTLTTAGKDYKTFSEQVSSREQIAQVYIAANSTNQNTQSNVPPSFSHATPQHYNNVQIISGSDSSHATHSPGYPIVSASLNSNSYVVYSSKSNSA